VKAVKAGRADFKLDKNGNIAASVGKASFEPKQLAENAQSFIEAVVRAKPASARGRYVETITLAATMSPALRIDVSKYIKL
jgi:large subunit ribosomal protein L1